MRNQRSGWLLAGMCGVLLACSSSDDEDSDGPNDEPDSGTVGAGSSSSSGSAATPTELDACTVLNAEQAQRILGTPMRLSPQLTKAQCNHLGDAPDTNKESSYQLAVTLIGSQTLTGFEAGVGRVGYAPLEGVGESAYILEKTAEVRDDPSPGGRATLDEVVIATFQRGYTISFGGRGLTRDVTVLEAKALLTRMP